MGRHAKYESAEAINKVTDKYFALCKKEKEQPEKAGLCLALGISRDTYSEYRKKYPDTIKAIDMYIESCWVKRLNAQAPTGAIFYLKNAFKEDFKDRTESDLTVHAPKPLLNALHNNNSNKETGQAIK